MASRRSLCRDRKTTCGWLSTKTLLKIAFPHQLTYTALSCCRADVPRHSRRALIFKRQIPAARSARGIFILPMMATPVAVALVWTMMFHPQLGVLNYLLTSVGLPPSCWIYHAPHRHPHAGDGRDVAVDAAGDADRAGRAGEPAASPTRRRSSTAPAVADVPPHHAAAGLARSSWSPLVIRTIDALKAFDTIYVITHGGPGTASETINIFLYLQAFAYYDLGYASAVVVVFFIIILLVSLLLLRVRQRSEWPERCNRTIAGICTRRLPARSASAFSVFASSCRRQLLVFLWMLSLSFKNELDNTAYPPVFIPNPPTLANFVACSRRTIFLPIALLVIVTGSASVPRLAGGRAGRLRHRQVDGKLPRSPHPDRADDAGALLPDPAILDVPVAGPDGHDAALMITHLVITVPIVVWVMIGFFEGLPGELEEAALMDGATIWQAFRHVALPLARPGITVATILAFIFSWNNFIFGVVLAGRETRTLPVAVYNVLTFEQISWGPLAAAAAAGDRARSAAHAAYAEGNRRRPHSGRRQGRSMIVVFGSDQSRPRRPRRRDLPLAAARRSQVTPSPCCRAARAPIRRSPRAVPAPMSPWPAPSAPTCSPPRRFPG